MKFQRMSVDPSSEGSFCLRNENTSRVSFPLTLPFSKKVNFSRASKVSANSRISSFVPDSCYAVFEQNEKAHCLFIQYKKDSALTSRISRTGKMILTLTLPKKLIAREYQNLKATRAILIGKLR